MKYRDSYKALAQAIRATGLVEIHEHITTDSLQDMKMILRSKGYKFFVKNHAYRTAESIGKKDKALTIREENGLFKATVIDWQTA